MAVFKGYHGGEGVWCNGMIESLERQGYTVLLAKDDWSYVAHVYRQIPDMVKVIIGDDAGGRYGKPQDYFKSDARPDGFPAWKFFRFYYFATPKGTVISNHWVVCAEIEWREVGMGNYRSESRPETLPAEEGAARHLPCPIYSALSKHWLTVSRPHLLGICSRASV